MGNQEKVSSLRLMLPQDRTEFAWRAGGTQPRRQGCARLCVQKSGLLCPGDPANSALGPARPAPAAGTSALCVLGVHYSFFR